MCVEVRHDKSGKDISGGSHMAVSAGAAGGTSDLDSINLCIKKGTCVSDSLNKGKTLTKNGIPVAFLKEKSYYDYHLLFFINRVKSKVIIDYNESNSPA